MIIKHTQNNTAPLLEALNPALSCPCPVLIHLPVHTAPLCNARVNLLCAAYIRVSTKLWASEGWLYPALYTSRWVGPSEQMFVEMN